MAVGMQNKQIALKDVQYLYKKSKQIFHNMGYVQYQCCVSGMIYPGSDHCYIPDSDPGVKKHRIPDPTYFCKKAIKKFCLLCKKHRIRNTVQYIQYMGI
jgi:hypothetical protein